MPPKIGDSYSGNYELIGGPHDGSYVSIPKKAPKIIYLPRFNASGVQNWMAYWSRSYPMQYLEFKGKFCFTKEHGSKPQ